MITGHNASVYRVFFNILDSPSMIPNYISMMNVCTINVITTCDINSNNKTILDDLIPGILCISHSFRYYGNTTKHNNIKLYSAADLDLKKIDPPTAVTHFITYLKLSICIYNLPKCQLEVSNPVAT